MRVEDVRFDMKQDMIYYELAGFYQVFYGKNGTANQYFDMQEG